MSHRTNFWILQDSRNMSFALNTVIMILASLGSASKQAPSLKGTNTANCPPKPLTTQAVLENGTKIQVVLSDYNICTCDQSDGIQWVADDGHPCMVVALGYNEEHTAKAGTCKSGTCMLTEIAHGCEDNKPGILVDGVPQVGCAHTCSKNGEKKFGYYTVGMNCTHLGDNGGNHTVTTCKQQGSKVICRESVPDPLTC